eukprot:CAMPEP_0174839408 /NCGR_PEP_ID=MMETSP1114-20130205/8019_1 /TAXON_ID=312471 /ORGANISM="Neobodo designis, Strain CCAP 1951/1" /LENGTH=529 /DNA_ID=CAMNT_0016073529 /DNA_START=44 /DNA_END=1633 /DNA_ORIENTATION=+
MPEAANAASSVTSTLMGWYDKAAEAIPNDGVRGALAMSRGTVEGVVEQAGDHAVTAQELAARLRGVSISAGGMPRSFLLGVRHVNIFVAVPCAAGALALHAVLLRRMHVVNVPSIEAGPDPLAPSLADRLRGWFTGEGVLNSQYVRKYHCVQMLLHGAAAALALYTTRSVLPPPVQTPGATAGGDDGQLVSTVRSVANSARALVGGHVKNHLPVALQRMVNCAAHADLNTSMRLAILGYGLHSAVVLYGSRAATATTRKVFRVVHAAATVLDGVVGIHALAVSSLPPASKLAAGAAFAFAATRVAAPTSSHCTSDPLRLVIATVSAAKTAAIVCSTSYGADRGRFGILKAVSMCVLGASLRATALPCSKPQDIIPRLGSSLPLLVGLHAAVDVAALLTLARLPAGTILPRVSLAPVASGTASAAGILAVVDFVALAATVAYQVQTNTFVALRERVVRVPVPLETFTQPSPTDNATAEQLEQLEREYDFAAGSTEKNMSASYDYLSRTNGGLSATTNGAAAAIAAAAAAE